VAVKSVELRIHASKKVGTITVVAVLYIIVGLFFHSYKQAAAYLFFFQKWVRSWK